MIRARELSFRFLNSALLGALHRLHRAYGAPGSYTVARDGISARFEGLNYAFSLRNRGATGNVDFTQDAENATRQAIFSMLRGNEVFYDIGAHGGVYTASLLSRFPDLVVHSFEPQPEELLENLRLNSLSTDGVHVVALGAEAGKVRMTTKFRSSNHLSEKGDRVVDLVRLEDYIAARALPPPNWIKIDIEGMELPALRGAERLLRSARPIVICEINNLFDRYGTTLPEFLGYMHDLGYRPHRLADGLHPIEGSPKTLSDLGYSADSNFWFMPQA